MQKKIIALAVAGLVSGAAFAQSNVTIYGNLDIGYLQGDQNTKNVAGAVVTKTNIDQRSTGFQGGALSTNHIGFRGTEDLGNGLKATFNVEMGMTEADILGADSGTDTAGAYTFRKQNLGLSGGFGTVTIGRQNVLIDEAWAVGSAGMKNNAVGDLYSSASGGVGINANAGQFHDARANEVITYVSPNFSGFTAAVQFGTGKTDTDVNTIATGDTKADHTNWGLRADYANGPLALVAAYNSEKNDATSFSDVAIPLQVVVAGSETDKDSWLLGANYNFGIVKVFGQYFDGSRNVDSWAIGATRANPARTDMDISGWELGVHVPVTAQITLAGSYFDTSTNWRTVAAGVGGALTKGDIDGNGYQLAALYSMSKRTTAYAMYGYEKSDMDQNASVNKNDIDGYNFAVGLKHAF
jgi:predicted porin